MWCDYRFEWWVEAIFGVNRIWAGSGWEYHHKTHKARSATRREGSHAVLGADNSAQGHLRPCRGDCPAQRRA